jgi:tetratricopeptide (TPR) repeat protein
MRKVFIVLVMGVLVAASSLLAQGPPPPPLSQKELVDILKSKEPSAQAVAAVEQRGVSFELNPEIEKQLRKAKASDAVIEAVKKGSPTARAERAAAAGAALATPEEQTEFLAVQNELNPDVSIQLAAEFEQKHPKSQLLTYVLALSAAQYEQKGDTANVIAQCEKSLALKSDNLMTLLIITSNLPGPRSLKTGDPEKKLAQTEKYATQALDLIANLTAQPNEQPEQFAVRKASYLRDMHSALGMTHLQRAMQSLGDPDREELAKGEAEYDTAVTISGDPKATDYYRLGEVRGHLKKTDAAIEALTRCIELDNGSGIKAYAEERIAELQKAKGQGPAKP